MYPRPSVHDVNRLRLSPRVVLLGVGCALFVFLLVRLNPAAVFSLLQRIGWHLALITAIYCLYEMLRTLALGQCVTAHDRPSYGDLLRIRISGEAIQFLTFTGPFFAEPAKASYLRTRGLTTSQAFAATVSEFLIYMLLSAVMSVAGLFYLLHNFNLSRPVAIAARINLYAASGFLAVASYAVGRRIYLIGYVIQKIAGLPLIRRLCINQTEVRHTEDLLLALLRTSPLRLLTIVLIESGAQMLLILELFVLFRAAKQYVPPLYLFLIESGSKFISVGFFFIPGQVGVMEGAYAVLFRELGLTASMGFALALARRLRSFFVAGIGLISAALWERDPGSKSDAMR